MYLPSSFPHQYLFSLPNNDNAVPEHYYSSSEGSDAQSCTAPATGEVFIDDGSGDSGIGPLAANDEPYMPPRTQPANPSPLHYTLPPDYVASQIGHSVSRDQYRNYDGGYSAHTGSYPPQYPPRSSYQQQQTSPEDFPCWDDPPYIPPGFTPPPPLALQTHRHFARLIPSNNPPPPPPPRPLIAPQGAYGLPSSPSSSESSLASYSQGYGPRHHQYHHHHQQQQQQQQLHHPQHHHHQQQHQHHPSQSFPPSPSAVPIQEESHASLSPGPAEAHVPPENPQQHEFSQSPILEPPPSLGDNDDDDDEAVAAAAEAAEAEAPRSRQWHETDKYLRNQIGIPEGTRVDLWALPDPSPGQKPQQPLPILVKLAIHGSDKGMLTLQEIYQTLEERFDYFARLKSSAWKNSIRHNLSLNQVFRSCDRPITEPGKGRYWSVDISKGEGYKRERRRKRRNAAPYNGTRDLPGGLGNQLNSSQADSSDGDQDMEDGTSMSESVTLKAVTTTTTTAKKVVRGTGRRGPYMRVTVAQPSIPGSTGMSTTPGPASTSVSPTLGAAASVPTATSAGGMSTMVYPNSAAMSSSSTSMGMAELTSATSLGQAPSPPQNAMHGMGGGVSDPSAVPRSYYQPAYGFTRAAMPTFGQPSLTAPATFNVPASSRPMAAAAAQSGMSYMSPGPSSSARNTAISISSGSGSDSENGTGRMMHDVRMGL